MTWIAFGNILMLPMWSRWACEVMTAFTWSVEYPSFFSWASMTSSRFWLGFRKSQLPAAQCFLHCPSETATLLPVSKTMRPFGWSMTHMLTGMVTSRAFSFGTLGMSPWMLNGPKKPLAVQYTPRTWASAAEGSEQVTESAISAAMIPSLFMVPLLGGVPTIDRARRSETRRP